MKDHTAVFQKIRAKYQAKRAGPNYYRLRAKRLARWLSSTTSPKDIIKKKDKHKAAVKHKGPRLFSLIDNTDAMLKFLHDGQQSIKAKKPIMLDLSGVKGLTPDSIALIISTITNPVWNKRVPIHGNAPKDINLRKQFLESGFYNHVVSPYPLRTSPSTLLHKQTSKKVKSDVAGDAIDLIKESVTLDDDDYESIYNILIELMSNTLHHANLDAYGVSNWWLYVSCDDPKTVSVCFIDLGVGIFKSMVVRNYFRKLGKSIKLINNIEFADDLLEGKIGSRIDVDQRIRGKGIPQIATDASRDCFAKFFLITNDVKMDLKKREYLQLQGKFRGTFIYFELSKTPTSNAVA